MCAQPVNAADTDFPYFVAGLNWSKNLGNFSNGCRDFDGFADSRQCHTDGNNHVLVLDDGIRAGSRAAQRCLKIGGRLPTQLEYVRVIKSFDHEEGRFPDHPEIVSLTAKGFASLTEAFGGEDLKDIFWTSSLGPWKDSAFVFDGSPKLLVGVVANAESHTGRNSRSAVRCVQGP